RGGCVADHRAVWTSALSIRRGRAAGRGAEARVRGPRRARPGSPVPPAGRRVRTAGPGWRPEASEVSPGPAHAPVDRPGSGRANRRANRGARMSVLIDTTEMYLRTILELEEEGVVPMRARIAERLDQSGPTVSQTVARMERDGLVSVAADRHLELTDEGR